MVFPETALIINPDIFGDKIDYSNQSAKVIGGKDYIIIRKDFLKYRDAFIVRNKIKTIGVTVGGSDYRNMLPVFCNYLINSGQFERINLFAGNENTRQQLKSKFSDPSVKLFGYLFANEMAQGFLETDMMISSSGQTLNELAFLGIPTIGFCLDQDQQYNVEGYIHEGFLPLYLYWDQPDLLAQISNLINSFNSLEARMNFHQIGKTTVSGKGVNNICQHIISL